MARKTNNFSVKDVKEKTIVIEENRRHRSPLALFFIRNGKLLFAISCLFSIAVFLIAIYLVVMNMKESSIVMYESNGVKVSFDGTDNSILNGTPITDKYAEKVFNSFIKLDTNTGVVIEADRKALKNNGVKRVIVFYSDGTALVKYSDGSYTKVFSIDGEYGIDKKGVIDSNAKTKELSGRVEVNKALSITFLYLSDGSIEVTKDNTTFFIRNSDITNTKKEFYTNLSGVSLPIKKVKGNTYYSDGTIKDNNGIIVNGKRYESTEKKNVYGNIKIIYYENGYAEIVKDNLSVMVKKKEHIVFDKDKLEIIENVTSGIKIKDIMDVKEIELNNTNNETVHYIVVLEETSDYKKHNVNKRLANKFIHFNVYIDGNKKYNNVLNNNLRGTSKLEGINLSNNTYLIHEGSLDSYGSTSIKMGFWIDYEDITNKYMNSAFIGTVKVYVESLS